MKRIFLFLIIWGAWFSPTTLYATDNSVVLGNVSPDQLRIVINTGGNYCVYRWINSAWQRQFYATNSHLFAIQIGATTFSSGGATYPTAGTPLYSTLTPFTLIEDIGTPVTSGVQQEMTKRFTATYDGSYIFSVTIRITYDTSAPDYFIKHATIDATNIPVGTPITFAYGWDTYVNLSDAGYAFVVPDIFGLNNNATVDNRYLTTAQVQTLRMVGARNNTGSGALIAFFPVGRVFDRAYSANPYNQAYCFNVPLLVEGNGSASGAANQYKFQFGPFSSGADNGTGVGYDNLPPGEVTEITTGLTFTPTLDGELDYFWNGVKDHTANIGDNVSLNLNYTSYSNSFLSNVGFRVDFPGLQIQSAGCSATGFSGGTANCVVGNEFFELSGAGVPAEASASIDIPVNITSAGQWVIDGNSITNTTQALPLGSPATLTVATTVSLADNTAVTVSKGNSKTFTVKFPGTVTATQDVTVDLDYSGATGSFSSMPASVIIPAGSNSATFSVTASPTGADNAVITITLSSTNQVFATIAEPSSVQLTILGAVTPGEISGRRYICPNESVTLTSTASTGGSGSFTYQWQSSPDGSSWSDIPGEINLSYTTGPLTIVTYYRLQTKDGAATIDSEEIQISMAPSELYWHVFNESNNNWNDPMNWTDISGLVLNAVPASCTDVHIPGDHTNTYLPRFPSLDTVNTPRNYGDPVCDKIFFHFGGEVAKPHLLTYNKAFVDYNFGYYVGTSWGMDGNLPNMAYSLKRGQWYALAAPLNKITPGDFSFGGKPDVWQQAFIRNNTAGTFAGEWEEPHNANATDIPGTQYGGIAIWMAQVSGNIGEDVQYQVNLNDLLGNIRMPFFEDPYLGAFQTGKHRIHEYTGGESRFYYYWSLDPDQPIEFTNPPPSTIVRGSEAYRFVFDTKLSPVYINSASDTYPTYQLTVPAGQELMIGNPFMSHLDFNKFWEINQDNLENQTYRLYVDNNWGYQYTVGSGGTGLPPLTRYIAPLQAFFIQTKGVGVVNLLFPPDLVSVTVSMPDIMLRAAGMEDVYDNVLYIEASNEEGSSWVTLGMKDGSDVYQLFNNNPLYVNVPQIYLLDGDNKNAVQFISGEAEVPIGIYSQADGAITLRFNNVERFNAESLKLFDKVLGVYYDLLLGSNEIRFDNISDFPDRFRLLVNKQTTGIQKGATNAGIQVRIDRKKLNVEAGEMIQQVSIANMQGIKMLNNSFINSRSFSTEVNVVPQGMYIVNVMLVNGERKIEKVIIKE